MRRFSAAIVMCLLAVGVFTPATSAAPNKPSKPVPKVVLIVGPAGSATEGYRAQARSAATIARKYTPDVVELYSPDATWPAVKAALAGASLVVYMGHGNGWPSKYRDALYPPSQNGFGLNPKAGGGDSTHQYFGEASVGSQVKLAKNAVVLLNHLCYASGNSEPGLPEGTFEQAQQRVDNYAAGFIKAGASAVIADAWSGPSYMVKTILGGGQSIQSAWQNGPSANHNRVSFKSARSPGYVAQMDPETATSGFTRSIVMKGSLAPKDVLAGSSGSAAAPAATPAIPAEPSLISTGLKLSAPTIKKLPSAGTKGKVDVPFKIKNVKSLPKGVQASARWDPIDVAIAPVEPAAEVSGSDATTAEPSRAAPSTEAPSASVKPAPRASAAASSASPSPRASEEATDPGDGPPSIEPQTRPRLEPPTAGLDLVVAERVGDVVAPAPVKFGKKAMSVPVTMPTAPGRYRLSITLHDADGVAYDAATQALLPSLVVRVTGDFDGAIQAAPTADVTAGSTVELGVRVVNLGVTEWGHKAVVTALDFLSLAAPDQPANVVGRWIPLLVGPSLPTESTAPSASARLPIGLAPGNSADVTLGLVAPVAPGDYLLLLDVVTPERGSLVASGATPTVVRVTVTADR